MMVLHDHHMDLFQLSLGLGVMYVCKDNHLQIYYKLEKCPLISLNVMFKASVVLELNFIF